MSHETLLAFAKKKIKPYNLAMKLTAPTLRTFNMSATGFTTLKFGFSPTNITSTATASGGSFTISIPQGSTNIYFVIPVPTTQLNSSLQFNSGTGTNLVTEVTYWETCPLDRLAFNGLAGLQKVPNALWTKCRSCAQMFSGCVLFNQKLDWDTSLVTSMQSMFSGCTTFNQPVNFNTINVTDMQSMFSTCSVFNQPVNFDTRKVVYFIYMFSNCVEFNQPINFNAVSALQFARFLDNCPKFNSPVSFASPNKITNVNGLFSGCTIFNQDLSSLIFKSSATRIEYDKNCTAWLPAYRPKFTG